MGISENGEGNFGKIADEILGNGVFRKMKLKLSSKRRKKLRFVAYQRRESPLVDWKFWKIVGISENVEDFRKVEEEIFGKWRELRKQLRKMELERPFILPKNVRFSRPLINDVSTQRRKLLPTTNNFEK